jgi:translation initiation factor 2 alpha subunit (eIF-2alpha)
MSIDKEILSIMEQKIPKPKYTTRATVTLQCFTENGVSSIREAFDIESKVSATVLAPPEYLLTYTGIGKESTESVLNSYLTQ